MYDVARYDPGVFQYVPVALFLYEEPPELTAKYHVFEEQKHGSCEFK
jgi:hypothetical protein